MTATTKELDVITWLRFPLMVAVVCIHAHIGEYSIINAEHSYSLIGGVQYFFSQIIARTAVPLFFMFSGYLFFYKVETFDGATYWTKIKKRIQTLLVPYFIWNLLYILFFLCIQLVFNMQSKPEYTVIADYSFKDWLLAFWNYHNTGMPYNFALWFIRDLFIITLFTPILLSIFKLEHKYFRHFSMLLGILGVVYLIELLPISKGIIPNGTALFFFTLGAYFSIHKKSFIPSKPIGITVVIAYITFIAGQMILYNTDNVRLIYRGGVILGVFSVIYTTSMITKWQINTHIAKSSFFMYVSHLFVLYLIHKICREFLPMNNQWCALGVYFGSTIATAIVCVLTYYILKKYMPKTSAILLGGR